MDENGWYTLDENRWYTLDENGWYTLDENGWYTLDENGWYTLDENRWYTLDENRWYTIHENIQEENNSEMLTPVKGIKGQTEWEKQFDKATNDLFSKAVSRVRQPIEAFFNWLIEKTDFQKASKVRSTKGLLVHVFGKMAAAFIYLIFNP